MAAYRTEFNEQVNQRRHEHIKQYEAPKTENIIVGFSGIDPDKKWVEESAKNEIIDLVKENIQELSEQAIREAVTEAVGDLPEAASDEEFDEMLNEMFDNEAETGGTEPSSPAEPTEPGTSEPETGGDDGAEAATDAEFDEMLSEVFGN